MRINFGLTEAEFVSRSRWMGRDNLIKRQHQAAQGSKRRDLKRARPTRNQAPSTLPNVDVHGILFAIVAVVFVVYPLAQWALPRVLGANGVRTTTVLVMRHPWLRCGDNIASMAWVPEI